MHSNTDRQEAVSSSHETDLADLWFAITRYKKFLVTTIGVLILIGWVYSLGFVKHRYSIESIVSLDNGVGSGIYSNFVVLHAKEFILPELIESSDISLKKSIEKIKVSHKKGTNFIFLKSKFLKPDMERHRRAHEMVANALTDHLNTTGLIKNLPAWLEIKRAKSKLVELSLPAYLLKSTQELSDKRTIEQDLLDQLSDESERNRTSRQIKGDIELLTEAYSAYVKAYDALKAELNSLAESGGNTIQQAEMLNAIAVNIRDRSDLMRRKKGLERDLQNLDSEITQRINAHTNRIQQFDKLIEFEEAKQQNQIAMLDSSITELENAVKFSESQIMIQGKIASNPSGLTKTKAALLTIPAAVISAFVLVLIVSFYSRIKIRQKTEAR